VICLAPRAREDSVRPRRLGDASVRPLNFAVRRQHVPTSTRLVVTVVSALATFFVFRVVGGLLFYGHAGTSRLVAAVVAIGAACFVWTQAGSSHPGLGRSVALGSLITDAIGFSAGFFGPILLTPGANQGPLLGIFITGPLGLMLGAVGGAIYWMVRKGSRFR
jgi:hypothetical protein